MAAISMLPVRARVARLALGVRRATLCLSLAGLGSSAVACASSGPGGAMRAREMGASGAPANPPTASVAQEAGAASVRQAAPQQLIRRGDMALEVEDVSATARRVERLATAMGGLVASTHDDGKDDAQVSLRVPQDRLDATMDSVAQLGHVERRATSTTDVTEQLLDLDARVATLTATRDRLRQLLARSDAVRDVIEVERELARVQSELESYQRRGDHLRGRVAMSDLSVSLERRVVLGPVGQLFRAIGVGIGKLFVWR